MSWGKDPCDDWELALLRAANREEGRKIIERAGGIDVVRERLRASFPELFNRPQARDA